MKSLWGVAPAVLVFAVLSGCASQPPAPTDPGASHWQARQSSLRALDAWTIEGRIALYNETEAWNADLHWRQRGERYDLRLVGPFGLGRMRVRGDADGVTLETPEGQYQERDPDTLFNRRLGWSIPLTGLKGWIRGLPSDRLPPQSKPVLDAQGRLRQLDQGGWNIRFIDYVAVDDLDLPGKIFLENKAWKVRLVIRDWRLQPE